MFLTTLSENVCMLQTQIHIIRKRLFTVLMKSSSAVLVQVCDHKPNIIRRKYKKIVPSGPAVERCRFMPPGLSTYFSRAIYKNCI